MSGMPELGTQSEDRSAGTETEHGNAYHHESKMIPETNRKNPCEDDFKGKGRKRAETDEKEDS